MIGVALPLIGLLGGLLLQSHRARRDDALAQQMLVLSREAELLAGRIDGELRSMRQIAQFHAWLASFVELTDRDIYALLIDTLERNPLIYSGRIAFAPGQAPMGLDRAAFYVHRNPSKGADGRDPYLGGNLALSYDYTDAPAAWYWRCRQEGAALWTEPYIEPELTGQPSIIDFPDYSAGREYILSRWAPWIRRPPETSKSPRPAPVTPPVQTPAQPPTQPTTQPSADAGYIDLLPPEQAPPICSIAVPFQRDGRFGGVVTIDIRLSDLGRISASSNRQNAWLAILSPEGRFVYWPERRIIMNETFRSLAERGRCPELVDLGLNMISARSGTTTVPDLDRRDLTHLVAYTPIATARWSLAAAVPEGDVMTPVYLALRDRAISAASVFGLVTLTILGIGAWLTRPIKRLAEGVQALETADRLDAPPVRIRSGDEIGDLARSFNRMVRQLKRRVQELTEATRAREAVLSELRVAREIQASLLPRLDPELIARPEFEFFAVNTPARQVAGDFYDFFSLPDGRHAIVIADVSGKGVPAAIFMAVARTVVRDLATRGEPPGRVLTEANQRLLADNQGGMFVTLFVGYYEPSTGTLSYANGGHQQPYVISATGSLRKFGRATGTIVGILPQQTYAADEDQLIPGETIILYTDGVTDARRSDGQLFGESRLAELLPRLASRSPRDLCADIVRTLDAWEGTERADDVTIVVLTRKAPRLS